MQVLSIYRRSGIGMHIDYEILKNCVDNDRRAQKLLYECCYKVFMPLCFKYNPQEEDARFAFNNAFLKILNGLKDVNLKEVNFFGWAKRIITNCLIDEYRKQRNHKAHYTARESEWELEIIANNSRNDAESNFGCEMILKMIDEIPENHALVFRMYVIDGYSHKEIAETLNLTVGTSKWHLSTARKLLRGKLEKLDSLTAKRMVV